MFLFTHILYYNYNIYLRTSYNYRNMFFALSENDMKSRKHEIMISRSGDGTFVFLLGDACLTLTWRESETLVDTGTWV
ncbi:hypothetical protein Hanom_Chr04g00366391 [Helianthus anomalus]